MPLSPKRADRHPARPPDVTFTPEGDGALVKVEGSWTIDGLADVDSQIRQWQPPGKAKIRLDLAALERLDTAGAWILYRTLKRLRKQGLDVEYVNAHPDHAALLARVEADDQPGVEETPPPTFIIRTLTKLGRAVVDALIQTRALLGFLGQIIVTIARAIRHPSRLRVTPLVYHIEAIGFDAVPIVSLISVLIGIVLAYQGATQLRQFGAEIFTVELVAISVLREIGILLTAILIAGRSGSAFTAQIGSMKLNEEIDAMRTLALDPVELLVLPRVLALIIALPMLAFIADIMGLLGGGIMCWIVLDITPELYLQRLNEWVPLSHFWVGIIKAPFFALTIGLIGCYEGLQVEGSAESVGRLTTKSVVEAIFLVMVLDGVFSIYFSAIEF